MSTTVIARTLDELTLTRRAPASVVPAALSPTVADLRARAADAGVPITYFALAPLPAEAQLMHGDTSSWVLAPAGADPTRRNGRLPIPAAERDRLKRLVDARIDFPAVVVAHEVNPAHARALAPAGAETPLSAHQLAELVGPVPPAPQVTALSQRLGRASGTIGRVARSTAAMVGAAAVTAPLAVAGVLDAGGLADPAVFGVLTPTGTAGAGEPGLWFLLASWCW
jgi:hypothetical protein